jgi:phage baseplate assembly protein W
MGIYNEVDISVSPSGDLRLGSNKDFILVSASGVLKQDVAFRLRTNPGEFIPHPELGAGLDDLIGEPNDRRTAKIGESKIIHSLVYDTRITNIDLMVRAVPISLESVVFYVFINNGMGQWNVTPDATFNMIEGMKNLPEA